MVKDKSVGAWEVWIFRYWSTSASVLHICERAASWVIEVCLKTRDAMWTTMVRQIKKPSCAVCLCVIKMKWDGDTETVGCTSTPLEDTCICLEREAIWVERWALISGVAWCSLKMGSGASKQCVSEESKISRLHSAHVLCLGRTDYYYY